MDITLTITHTKMKPIVLFITEYLTEMFTKYPFLKLVKFSKPWHRIPDLYGLSMENKRPTMGKLTYITKLMLEPYIM